MNMTESNVGASEVENHERELCRTCLEPNEPGATFCKDCGAPLSSYAATGPFESLLTEGHLYRQAAEHPRKLIILIGMWLIFGFVAFTSAFVLLASSTKNGSLWGRIFGLPLFAIATAILWRTTRNYFRIRSAAKSPTAVGN